MKLGELEFKADDFKPHYGNHEQATAVCELANTILREKLAKAPEVFGYLDSDFGMMVYMDDAEGPYEVTHRARLVCVEDISNG